MKEEKIMEKKTFAEVTQDLHAALEKAQIQQPIANNILDLHRGPYSGTEAIVSYFEYSTMDPGPGPVLTLDDVARLMQQSADDWKISLKALEQIKGYVARQDRVNFAVEFARHGDWQRVRNEYSNSLPKGREEVSKVLL